MKLSNLSRVLISGSSVAVLALGLNHSAYAAQTTGGISWIDPLAYSKPRFYPLTVPDEAAVTNKYYVNLSSGSGSTCSQAAPCRNITDVAGKAGTTGGPAYIYLKGAGRMVVTGTLYGAVGKEIVIKPWPGDGNMVTMSTTGSGGVGGANTIQGSGVHHLVVDGGPTMQFDFVGANSPNDQNAYTLVVSSNYVTVARSRIHSAGGYGPALGVATGAGTYDHIWIVNNEIYDANKPGAPYGVYTGGGTGCAAGDTSHSYVYFLNNIVRNICGRGIQVEPRRSGTFTYVEGNAFHDTGTNSCGFGQVSNAVQPAASCGGSISDFYVKNNIMFSLGGGGVVLVGDFPNTYVLNNTIYDYAKATPLSTSSHGISCYSDGCKATVKNNIVLYPNAGGLNPINRGSGFVTANNLCESGTSCGSKALAGTRDSVFSSYSSSTASFLSLKSTAGAVNAGESLFSSGVTVDYLGALRPSSGAFDIGAIEYGSTSGALNPPTNLRVVP